MPKISLSQYVPCLRGLLEGYLKEQVLKVVELGWVSGIPGGSGNARAKDEDLCTDISDMRCSEQDND